MSAGIKNMGGTLAVVDSEELMNYLLIKFGRLEHSKIHKLMYYTQAFHLAKFKRPIIEDNFQAWLHGPVSRKIYDVIRPLGVLMYSTIRTGVEAKDQNAFIKRFEAKFSAEQLKIIRYVLEKYGVMTAFQLESLTHEESPWIEARDGYGISDNCEEIITKESMMNFYSNQLPF